MRHLARLSTLSLRRLLPVPVAAALIASALPAGAQPTTRGTPVLRTPPRRPGDATGGRPGAAPGGGNAPAPKPPNAPGGGNTGGGNAPGAGNAGGGNIPGPDDPMAGVKQGAKEIEWKPKPGGTRIKFNLDDADLPELVKSISNITGKRFIYGGKLRQIKATVYSPEEITANEAYSAFLSILDTNGMTVIPHGRFLKIVESPGVVTDVTPVYGTATPVPDEARYVTRLYRLSHIDANDAATVLSKFKSKEADITIYPAGNLLIITETGSNLHRLMRIVEEIDVGGAGEQIWVQPLNYTSASDLANRLNDILDLRGGKSSGGGGGGAAGKGAAGGGGGGGAQGTRIVADERGNALIIIANESDYLRLLELIKRLDVKQSGEGEIHVLSLQYAACKDLSQTLNQILGTGGGGFAGAQGARPAAGGQGARQGSATPGAAGSGLDEVFEGKIRVTCDESTNSIVTTSSLRDYAQLRTVIDKLDRPRRQVFIEAVIMDVNVDRSTDLGLSYHGGAPINFGSGEQGVFYGGNNPSQSILGVPANLEALALGLRGPEISGSQNLFGTGISIPALGVVMHALAKDGDSNVLATPHILATDNTPAEISIGQNIPLQTNVGGLGSLAGLAGQAGGAGAGALGALGGLGGLGGLAGGLGFQTPRQDVGTKIKVIPHVNDSDQVRLELTEEISEAGAPIGAIGAIPINKRTANTTLVVRDQQTVVIGGLVRDSVTNGETKIPILGDIPVLGLLFKQTQRKKTKSNLMLVLTPYVIRDQDDLRAIFERKMQERQEFLDRYFVFGSTATWQAPRDFSRTNGLVEDIRQSIMDQEEKAKIEAETKPKAPKIQEAVKPLALPTRGGGDDGGGGGVNPVSPPGQGGGVAPQQQGGTRPRVKLPSGGGAPVPRSIDRLE